MKGSLAFQSFLCGLALAGPVQKRQDLDLDSYDAVAANIVNVAAPIGDSAPQSSVTYNPTAVASVAAAAVTGDPAPASQDAGAVVTIAKRAACTTRSFNGPQVTDPADTPEAFVAYQGFADAANAAAHAAHIPSGYAVVPGYVNLKASASAPGYLTYVSSRLTSYDPAACAAICDTMNGCKSFNIYFERDPLVVPDASLCPATATSASATLIKCAFYGLPLAASQAKNKGGWSGSFQIVIAGANAYVKSGAPSVDGYEGPVCFGNASINAPSGYIRSQTFGTNVPYDPSLCAASCAAQTAYNARHGSDVACVFFDAYLLYKNGENPVFTCAYYTTGWGVAYAKNTGQTRGADKYTVESSYGYYLDGNWVA